MAASVQDMGIDHGRADILVPKEFLDGADVIACFKQMRGKGMSEGVTTDMLNYARIADCFLDAPLHFTSPYNSVLHGSTKSPRR